MLVALLHISTLWSGRVEDERVGSELNVETIIKKSKFYYSCLGRWTHSQLAF